MLERALAGSARRTFLQDIPAAERASQLRAADVLLSWIPAKELRAREWDELGGVSLMQLISAGADLVPFAKLPSEVMVASNAGAYAEPMAERVLAMTLALAKRLRVEHEKMWRGEFDQSTLNRSLRGATCTILGFGGSGELPPA